MNNIDDLIKTLRDLKSKNVDVPEDLVIEILKVEASFCEDRHEAIKRIEKLVDDYLEKENGKVEKCLD